MFQACDVLHCFYSIGRIIHVALTLLSPKLFFWLFEKFKVKNLSLVFGSLFDTITHTSKSKPWNLPGNCYQPP